MPIPKYKLKASRVDRIAIVDNPCVPDAQIVVFKRKDSEPAPAEPGKVGIIEHISRFIKAMGLGMMPMDTAIPCCPGNVAADFNSRLVPGMLREATQALTDQSLGILWDDKKTVDDRTAGFKAALADYRKFVIDVVGKMAVPITKQDAPGSKITTDEIVRNYKDGLVKSAIYETFRGLGGVLTGLYYSPNQVVDINDAAGKVMDAFEAQVIELIQKQPELIKAMKEQVETIILHNKGTAAPATATDKAREEISMTAQEKALLEKVAADVAALTGEITAVKAAVAADKAAIEAEKAQAQEAEAKSIEKRATEAQAQVELEKKAKEETLTRIGKIEGTLESVSKFMQGMEKRLGIKTSLEADGGPAEPTGDPFKDALKKK